MSQSYNTREALHDYVEERKRAERAKKIWRVVNFCLLIVAAFLLWRY